MFSGVVADCSSSWRGTKRAGAGVRGRVERVAEHEPRQRERRRGDRCRRRRRATPAAEAAATPIPADDQDLRRSPSDPQPDDLAGEQLAGLDRRQQHLDHPGRLLLDHPRRDPVAEREQLPEQQQDRDEREPPASWSGPCSGVERRTARRGAARPARAGSTRAGAGERAAGHLAVGRLKVTPSRSPGSPSRGLPCPRRRRARVDVPVARPLGLGAGGRRTSTSTFASNVGAARAAARDRRRGGARDRRRVGGRRRRAPSTPATTATRTTMSTVIPGETRNDFSRTRSVISRRATSQTAARTPVATLIRAPPPRKSWRASGARGRST